MGKRPCPKCLARKADVAELGTAEDQATRVEHTRNPIQMQVASQLARDHMHKDRMSLQAEAVKKLIVEESLIAAKVGNVQSWFSCGVLVLH